MVSANGTKLGHKLVLDPFLSCDPNLERSTTLLFIVYYMIGNGDYIKLTKILEILKWKFQKLLELQSYESCYFVGSYNSHIRALIEEFQKE